MSDYGYIYKTTNLINGRIYIGQKKGIIKLSYLGSGEIIKKAIKLYGKENFRLEVVAFASTIQMLDGLEMKYIYEYRQVYGKDFLYNITNGGHAPMTGRKHSEKTKLSYSNNRKGKYNPMFGVSMVSPMLGKKHSEESKNNIKEGIRSSIGFGKWNKGRRMSEELKRVISIRNKGNKSRTGHIFSAETRDKISKAKIEYYKNKKLGLL